MGYEQIADLLAEIDHLRREREKLSDAEFYLATRVVPALEDGLLEPVVVRLVELVIQLREKVVGALDHATAELAARADEN